MTTAIAAETTSSFNLLNARERGATGTGTAKGSVLATFDEAIKKDVLECDYSIAQGSALKIWSKSFPDEFAAAGMNMIKISVKIPKIEQVNQISMQLEVKGSKDVQTIPLRLKAGLNSVQEAVDVEKIGTISEIVFVVTPLGETIQADGSLMLSLDFMKKASVQKASPTEVGAANNAVAAAKGVTAAPVRAAPVVVRPAAQKASYAFMDALEKGTSGLGTAKGTLAYTFDEVSEKDVIDFAYTVPKDSSVNIWAKKFPLELNQAAINAVKIGIRVLSSEQVSQISIRLDIKGTKGLQSIPIRLKSGWNAVTESIDWDKVGSLSEASFVVSSTGGIESAKGSLFIALDFVKLKTTEKVTASKEAPAPFSLWDAGERGVFNINPASGSISTFFDETLAKDVWKFDYAVPQGSHVGIWTKSYPADLNAKAVDAVRIAVNVPKSEQLNQVSVKVEVKGMNSVQTIPLCLKPGWNYFRESVDWGMIGDLKEVVFVVSPIGVSLSMGDPLWFNPAESGTTAQSKPMTGALYFDLDFGNLTFLQKNIVFIKVGLALAGSLLLALLVALLGMLFKRKRCDETLSLENEEVSAAASRKTSVLSGLKWDLFYGIIVVLIIGVALRIYMLGMLNPLVTGLNFDFLGVGLAGALLAELLKFRLTGKHLTSFEAFQNFILTGVLAASSSRLELLQSPASWVHVLMISNLTAAIAFLIYQIFNAYSFASSQKHLKTIAGVLIVGTPYLFGWLLLVENINILKPIVNSVTVGLLAAWPMVLEVIGRIFVIFVFNEAVTNGIGLVTKGRTINTFKAHWTIFLVSLGVIISPLIADLGSIKAVAALPEILRAIVAVLTTMLSYGGLWGEVYLITGILLDGGHRAAPSAESIDKHVWTGSKKGMAFSGILMGLMYILHMVLYAPAAQKVMTSYPLVVGILSGALIFPLIKTIIETFDGSIPFFERTAYGYRSKTLFARGAVVGFGFAYMVSQGMFLKSMQERILFGLLIGLVASGGMSFLRDCFYAMRGRGRIQTWKMYLTDGILGAFIGSAAAFYLDSLQVPVVVEKFKLYVSSGLNAVEYITYPLVNKWGRIDLGTYTGGVKLIYIESLAGVINWSVAAWLFAINKVFMQAYFEKQSAPIKFFFSKAGFATLVEHMIYVLRWGLWMSPIIFTFLRMMPDPTWYNQDGAIRTLFAIYNNVTMSSQDFSAWSLKIFVYVMAFDFFRILIWMDHMGLRVATLVNLSFLGLDRLDEKIAKFIGPAAAQRYIPDAVKRFATWAPLLIPFYLPRGQAWDYVWSTSEAMQNAARGKGLIYNLQSLGLPQLLSLIGVSIVVCAFLSCVIRMLHRRARARKILGYELGNREYKVVVKENGEAYSEAYHNRSTVYPPEFDVSRRTYDTIDPCGRILFLVDTNQKPETAGRFWPVLGNFPRDRFQASFVKRFEDSIRIVNTVNGVKTTIDICLPDQDTPAELWNITVENLTNQPRKLKVVTYLEWLLNGGIHDRFHTQYARLYPEMEYSSELNAILTWQKASKAEGFLASDVSPEGFLTSRVDFIGRARSVWSSRIFETMSFSEARDTAGYPTFDPIGSLMLGIDLEPRASKSRRLMIGYSKNKKIAVELIKKYLKPVANKSGVSPDVKKKFPLIGHGEIPEGTPQPYSEFIEDGKKLLVRTPFTTRPYDHAMSNATHSMMVTNRGLHTSCNGNSQQNRLTPDWPDTVTKEIPTEAIYLYDPDSREWYSPTYNPLNDRSAKHECEFGVDGTALFRMTKGTVSTELTLFVPPNEPMGVYLLTVKNLADQSKRMRIAPYFQMVLAFQPEKSGVLQNRYDKKDQILYVENPRNEFRLGTAFVSMSIPTDCVETKRGRFFGTDRGIACPYMVEQNKPDATQLTDIGQIAGLLGTVEIPAHGECTVAIVLGQTDDRKGAVQLARKYKNMENVRESLSETKKWWLGLMETVVVKTNDPSFDRFQHWLKYQALAERIWARRGFYQTSGAYGFRDQLQDTVNMIWVDPALARKQIMLCASHQFMEGDVYHWFFTRTDGRTAFSCRSHASDNPVWLSWAVGEYVRMTGDATILNEMTSYVAAQFPFASLPKNKQGWGHLYHRSTRADTVYRHCMRSINLVLEKRMGKHGLPLMGTGDWNDGLDEIGSEGKGESVWLGFFVYYILKNMLPIIEKQEGSKRKEHYSRKMKELEAAIELTWRDDRYLRAFHDDGTEIGLKGSGIWEIDALTAAWAVMSGINFKRGLTVFNTALNVLEKEDTILLGWPALREDTKPYLGRSSKYPEGVRENGMYCHGVQWLVRAARILAEEFEKLGDQAKAGEYRAVALRLWQKVSPISHVTPEKIEIYGGQPNKQSADILTNFDPGRMIWHGYTGAAGWMLRQAIEGVVGASLINNEMILPADLSKPRGELKIERVQRDVRKSQLNSGGASKGKIARSSQNDRNAEKNIFARKEPVVIK